MSATVRPVLSAAPSSGTAVARAVRWSAKDSRRGVTVGVAFGVDVPSRYRSRNVIGAVVGAGGGGTRHVSPRDRVSGGR